jgi:hypothetical protein
MMEEFFAFVIKFIEKPKINSKLSSIKERTSKRFNLMHSGEDYK